LDFAEFIPRREVEPSDEDKKWLFQVRGKWRWSFVIQRTRRLGTRRTPLTQCLQRKDEN
jgi:hypothetical protein